jgi:hypothetical protein
VGTGAPSGGGLVCPFGLAVSICSRGVRIGRRWGREKDEDGDTDGLRYGVGYGCVTVAAFAGEEVAYQGVVSPDPVTEGSGRVWGASARMVHDPSEDLSAAEVIAHAHRLSIGTVRLSIRTVNQIESEPSTDQNGWM